LLKRGHQVSLFAPGNSRTSADLHAVIERPLSEKDISEKQKKAGYTFSIFSTWNTAEAYHQARKFDIIHTHLGNFGQIKSAFLAPLVNTPTVSTIHCPLNEIATRVLEKFSRNQTFVGISHNQLKRSSFFKRFPVVYHGINEKEFSFSNKRKDYLLFIGRLHLQKGADIAIKISRILKIPLKLAGQPSSSQKEYFDQKIKPYLKDSSIEFLGKLSKNRLSSLYQNAKALLFPIQWEEPFGLVMIEAMACGTPVIAFGRGSVPEIVKDGRTGFIIEPGDIDGMVKAVKKIDQIDRMACRRHVEENFTIERMVEKYEKIYKKIIKENKK